MILLRVSIMTSAMESQMVSKLVSYQSLICLCRNFVETRLFIFPIEILNGLLYKSIMKLFFARPRPVATWTPVASSIYTLPQILKGGLTRMYYPDRSGD